MRNQFIVPFALLLIIVFALYGCGSKTTPASDTINYKDITAEQLKSMLETNQNLLLVDVREQVEFAQGHISESLLIPTSELDSRVSEIPKDRTVVLVCASGARSSQVASYLIQLGYTDVYNLSGGISTWSGELVK